MTARRPVEPPKKSAPKTPSKALAPEVKEALRTLAMHTAAVEAKLWATVHFLAASGAVNMDDYKQFMLKSQVPVSEAQKKFFNRIGKTLQKRGVL